MIIDSNIFLEFLLSQKNAMRCRNFLNKIVVGEIKAMVSDFTIDSVIIGMEKHNAKIGEIRIFLNKLMKSKGIGIYPIRLGDRFKALNFMNKYNLSYEDSIVLQSAIATSSKEIVSFDKHFDKVKEIKRIEP